MLFTVNGSTDVYLVLGDPVEQVRAPKAFNLIFATLGINAVLVPVRVPLVSVQDFVRTAFSARNIKGLFLMIPHKSRVMEMLDECSELGRLAGAVNAVRCDAPGRLVAHPGFELMIRQGARCLDFWVSMAPHRGCSAMPD